LNDDTSYQTPSINTSDETEAATPDDPFAEEAPPPPERRDADDSPPLPMTKGRVLI